MLVTFYPSGVWPSRMQRGYVVAPGFHDSALPIAPPVQFYCTPRAAAGGTGDDAAGMGGRSGATTDLAEEGAPPGSSTVRLAPAAEQGWRHAPAGALAARCTLPLHDGTEDALHLLVERRDDGGLGRTTIYRRPDASQPPLAELTLGEWSAFGSANWGRGATARAGSIRFHLLAVDHEQPTVRFVTSQVYSTQGIAAPTALSEEIMERCGPFFDTFSINPVDGAAELRAFLGDIRYQGEWEVKVARYVAEHGGWDHHYCHWHLFDHINHPTVNPADPDGPDYDPERGAWMIEAQRQTYILGDAVLKQFLELADDETLVCVISDHAMAPAHRWAHLNARLEETGLLALQPDGAIDFSQSQVYTQADRGSEVFVNLRGREPMGIVPAADYARVQEAIIDALLDWRDPLTDKRAVALALKLEDGQLIGFWGDICGDVVFTFNRGFGWGPPLDGGSIGQGRGALHGSQVPHAETPHFTNMGCWILAGPGVKAGYERDWQRHGLMRMTDVAPDVGAPRRTAPASPEHRRHLPRPAGVAGVRCNTGLRLHRGTGTSLSCWERGCGWREQHATPPGTLTPALSLGEAERPIHGPVKEAYRVVRAPVKRVVMPEQEDGPGWRRRPIQQLGSRLRYHERHVTTRQMPCQYVYPWSDGFIGDAEHIGLAHHAERPAGGKPRG